MRTRYKQIKPKFYYCDWLACMVSTSNFSYHRMAVGLLFPFFIWVCFVWLQGEFDASVQSNST